MKIVAWRACPGGTAVALIVIEMGTSPFAGIVNESGAILMERSEGACREAFQLLLDASSLWAIRVMFTVPDKFGTYMLG